MSLDHILTGCSQYDLRPLMSLLLDSLRVVSPTAVLKTLHLNEWGSSPWYPLLALRALEHNALRPFKGVKKVIKKLKESRPWREWLIGSFFWAIWKWRMKEIHNDNFRFVPLSCTDSLQSVLSALRPEPTVKKNTEDKAQAPAAKARLTDGAYK